MMAFWKDLKCRLVTVCVEEALLPYKPMLNQQLGVAKN